MNIIPEVRRSSDVYIELDEPIKVKINKNLLTEINGLFDRAIFVYDNDGFIFVHSNIKGYEIDFNKKQIKFNIYKDKVNSLFSIAQYFISHQSIPEFIQDWQEFEWIGFNIDIARNFFNQNELKKLILIYASLKYNRAHIHLTDDQGWRIEIQKYPELTKGEEFLYQEDIKDLIEYSKLLGVQIVPEVGIPGHTMALLSKIEGLACNSKKVEKWDEFGVADDVLCLSNPKTREVIINIYKEVTELFPGDNIHIGGDECPTKAWENCGTCKKKCSDNNYSVQKLQKQWTQSIIDELNTRFNKKVIIWDDLQEFEKYSNLTVGFWRSWMQFNNKEYLNTIAKNNNLIISPVNYVYLDWTNDPADNKEIGMASGWTTNLKKTFEFNPLDGVNLKYHNKVLGSEVSLWTERIKTFERLIYQAFPRSFAVAEILWGTKKTFDEFKDKIDSSKYVEIIAKDRFKGKYE